MNEAPMMAILALACGSTSAYMLFRPEAVKRANESERYRGMGFGSKPLWFCAFARYRGRHRIVVAPDFRLAIEALASRRNQQPCPTAMRAFWSNPVCSAKISVLRHQV